MTQTVLILGASGKIGRHASLAFEKAGWIVRKYDRSKNDMAQAAIGVDVIVNGLNPPNYHNWTRLIPQITAHVIDAAKTSGATVIIPGNVYNFGETPGEWSEATPQRPTTRKGQIRKDMELAYRQADVPTIIVRAGNFIDPLGKEDIMDLAILREIAKGKIGAMGLPDTMQAYCYLPDWARAAVALAEMRNELELFEDIPFPGHAFTTHQIKEEFEAMLGRPLKLSRFPWWLMSLASPFWELAREMNEMRGLWNTSHTLSGEKLSRLLPDFEATDSSLVLRNSLPPEINPDQRMARTVVVGG